MTDELLTAAQPLIEFLKKNTQGVHVKVIVETDYIELVQGMAGLSIEENSTSGDTKKGE